MELSLLPFKKIEYERKYAVTEFVEDGVELRFLRQLSQKMINSGNKYRFGLIDSDNKYHWFFYGVAVAKDREKAIQIFNALSAHCFSSGIGKPFMCKE